MMPDGESVDAFHRGAFHLVQPSGRGHRAGLDAMLVAACLPDGFSGTVADLGAGAGAAGLAVLSRCPESSALLVERDPDMADFARRSLALGDNAHLAARARVIEADVALRGADRLAAGLADRCCDFVVTNPPFNAPADRASPDTLRRDAHVMETGTVENWTRTAAAMLRPRGGIAIIARPASLSPILAAFEGRFGGAELVAVHPRPDAPAIRILLRAWSARRSTLSIRPALVLHGPTGNAFQPHAQDVINGRAGIFPVS